MPVAHCAFRLRTAVASAMAVLLLCAFGSAQGYRYDNVVQTTTTTTSGQTVATPASGVTVTACYTSPISTLSETGTTVTATTAIAHGLVVGQSITIVGASSASYNGTYTVATTPTTTSFTFISAASGLAIGTGGTELPNNVPCTPLATVYTDSSLGSAAANPATSDSQGNYGFWFAPGSMYVIALSGGAITPALYTVTTPGKAAITLNGIAYPTISAALSAVPSSGGDLYIPAGTYSQSTQIASSNPVWLHGAGINNTIIKPTSALAASLFSFTTNGEGLKISDLTIDMTNVPAQDAIDWNGPQKPIMTNVRILYAAGATGKALSIVGVGECHVSNLIIKQAGYGVYINGDGGAEHFFTDVVIESPTTVGFDIERTTVTDVGGWYLLRVKVTNPFAQNGSVGIKVNSTLQNTIVPLLCTDCVADSIQGGPSLLLNNVNEIMLTNPWLTNTAPSGSNFPAASLTNVNQINWFGGHLSSNSRDLTLAGQVGELKLITPRFEGTSTNIYAASLSACPDMTIQSPLFSASTPVSSADAATLVACGNTITPTALNGGEVWVSGASGNSKAFRLVNKESGNTAPIKGMEVSALGDFKIINNAGNAAILDIPDAAQLTAPSIVGTLIAKASSGTIDLTAQGANVASATLYAVPSSGAGLYRVSCYVVVTQAATTSSTLPSCVISWTDTDNSTVQSFTVTPTNTGNALTTLQQGVVYLDAKASTNITYSTTGYVSTGATPMQYAVHIRLEAL